jgi:hypothetical protein
MPVMRSQEKKVAHGANRHRSTSRRISARTEVAVANEELQALRADIFALKMILPALLSRVGRLDPILGSAVQEGFQDATDQVEHIMAFSRGIETRDRCTNALASIRRLRAAVLTS